VCACVCLTPEESCSFPATRARPRCALGPERTQQSPEKNVKNRKRVTEQRDTLPREPRPTADDRYRTTKSHRALPENAPRWWWGRARLCARGGHESESSAECGDSPPESAAAPRQQTRRWPRETAVEPARAHTPTHTDTDARTLTHTNAPTFVQVCQAVEVVMQCAAHVQAHRVHGQIASQCVQPPVVRVLHRGPAACALVSRKQEWERWPQSYARRDTHTHRRSRCRCARL
jgi:hypothetical protein